MPCLEALRPPGPRALTSNTLAETSSTLKTQPGSDSSCIAMIYGSSLFCEVHLRAFAETASIRILGEPCQQHPTPMTKTNKTGCTGRPVPSSPGQQDAHSPGSMTRSPAPTELGCLPTTKDTHCCTALNRPGAQRRRLRGPSQVAEQDHGNGCTVTVALFTWSMTVVLLGYLANLATPTPLSVASSYRF